MQCSMTLVNAGGLVWYGEDGHGLNLNCQRAERDMLRRAGDGSGRSGVRFSQVTSLTSAMLPRPEWVIFTLGLYVSFRSDPDLRIGADGTASV